MSKRNDRATPCRLACLQVELPQLHRTGLTADLYHNKEVYLDTQNRSHIDKKHADDLRFMLQQLDRNPDLLNHPYAYSRHSAFGQDPRYNNRFEAFYRIGRKTYLVVFMYCRRQPGCLFIKNCFHYENAYNRLNKKRAAGLCFFMPSCSFSLCCYR